MKLINYIIFVMSVVASSTAIAVDSEGRYVIAFAQDTLDNDFRKAQVFEARDEAKKHSNLSFIYSDARGDTSLLIRQIYQFTSQKVDLMIVGTNDEIAVVPAVSRAYAEGIPVIVLDRGIKGRNYTSFINSDNIKIGRLGAEYIADKLNGAGLVLLFEGLQEADVTRLRSKGFMDEISKHKGIRVIKRTGNYLRKDAVIEMEKLIKEGIRVDAIFSESDSMLSGVRLVLDRYGIDPTTLMMIGCDYTSEARTAIREGSQTGSVLFPLGGTRAIEIAVKIFKEESVPKHIYNEVKMVDENNVEKVTPIF